METVRSMLVLFMGMILGAGSVDAKIVMLNIDLPLDVVATGVDAKVNDHYKARVFYDDSDINRKTKLVKLLNLQHFSDGEWRPTTLDPLTTPMNDAWLDLGSKPYGIHYRAEISDHGQPCFVVFDEKSHRFSILLQKDLTAVISAPYYVSVEPVDGMDLEANVKPLPAYISLNLYVVLDKVAPGEADQVGTLDKMRVTYDANTIDPSTKIVRLLNVQKLRNGGYLPPHPDALMMPMNDAWLDLSSRPYRLHFHAVVTHGKPIIIDASENTRRLEIRSQQDAALVLVGGSYAIDDTVTVIGPEATAAATVLKQVEPW